MTLVISILGAALALIALYDMFSTLFRPGENGTISTLVSHWIWRVCHVAGSRGVLSLAGPLAFVASAVVWATLLTAGWGLIYWRQMPGAFNYGVGLAPAEHSGLGDALYLSLVTLATLGYGDISPLSGWARALAPMQALVGFVLLSAVVTWLLSIYPDLARRSAFARYVTSLRDAARTTGIDPLGSEPATAQMTLQLLTTELITISGDMTQFPVTYYFHNSDDASSLPAAMPYILELAERGCSSSSDAVRLSASQLQRAIDHFAGTIAVRFLPSATPEATGERLRAYATDNVTPWPEVPQNPNHA